MAVTREQHLTQLFQFEVLHTSATSEEETLPIKQGGIMDDFNVQILEEG